MISSSNSVARSAGHIFPLVPLSAAARARRGARSAPRREVFDMMDLRSMLCSKRKVGGHHCRKYPQFHHRSNSVVELSALNVAPAVLLLRRSSTQSYWGSQRFSHLHLENLHSLRDFDKS